MGKKATKPYRRLDRAERAAIERGLDKRKSCRQMARELGRSPSTVADEVARNRTVSRGPGKGAGARRRRAARVEDGSGPGRGRVRTHTGPDKVRRGARAVARADRAGQGGRGQGLARPPYTGG